MASYPDILITASDSPRVLVAVEARLDHQRLENAILQLKRYLVQMSCPVGLLVLPDELYLYRNKYTGIHESDVEQIGRYSLGGLFEGFRWESEKQSPQERGRLFESYVQNWLERLPWGRGMDELTPELKRDLETHVAPALEAGIVRAAGPRERWSRP